MDFLEQNYIHYIQNPRYQRRMHQRTTDDIMNNMRNVEFKKHFRFSKECVREIGEVQRNFLLADIL